MLEKRGFAVTDADKTAHSCLEAQKEEIIQTFASEAERRGLCLQRADGQLDRRALGALLFSDPALLERHEAILYPAVCRELIRFANAFPHKPVAINAAVLYKTELLGLCSRVLFIDAPCPVRLLRIKKRDGLPLRQILARFRAQTDIYAQYRRSGADIYRVWNLGGIPSLERKIDRFARVCLQ